MTRLRTFGNGVWLVTLAVWLGTVLRGAIWAARYAPGVLAPVLVTYGVWQIYAPAGWISAGVILWAVDRWVIR